MQSRGSRTTAGFSLVELVIVVAIIGTIAAIAIPRMTQATKDAGDSALSRDLAVLRNAIELYAGEHNGVYPGQRAAGGDQGKAGTAQAFVSQLTMYSDADGQVAAGRDKGHLFGPYLRKGIPPLPAGTNKGISQVEIDTSNPQPVARANVTGFGWIYNPNTGEIAANSADSAAIGSTSPPGMDAAIPAH